nr:MAG TPA_asm: hypothetical protein [Caudoviricetes sp.]
MKHGELVLKLCKLELIFIIIMAYLYLIFI